MPAADAPVSPFFTLLVPLLPALLSPIVIWALGRSRISKEAATIDYLNKRLDVLERLNKLHTQLTEGPIRPFLDAEIKHCQAFLQEPRTFFPRNAGVKVAAPQSLWDRFFLTPPRESRRKRVFRGLFYFFFGFAVLGLVAAIFMKFLELPPGYDGPRPQDMLLGGLFYLALALLCRRAAR